MNEKMPIDGLTPGERERQDEESQYEQWMKDHPEEITAPEDLKECGPEIADFEKMIASFEAEHSLADLLLIVDLTQDEAPHHPAREPARLALPPIVAKLNFLKKETNISTEKYKEIREKYMRLSRAVGMINNNKVHHDR